MTDAQLEALIRADPTGDPSYVPGRFRDRAVIVATERIRRERPTSASRGMAVATIVALVIATALVIRSTSTVGPGPSPTPPSSTEAPAPTAESPAPPPPESAVIAAWAAANGDPGYAMTVIRPRGEIVQDFGGPIGESFVGDRSVRIGSASSMFLVSAVVGLDECARRAGLITCPGAAAIPRFSLDDRVGEWLPNLRLDPSITVRMIVAGTSGVAAVAPTLGELRTEALAGVTRDALLDRALKARPRFAPGSAREAVDTEPILMEEVIAAVTGQAAARWIEDVAVHGHGTLGQAVNSIDPDPPLAPGHLSGGERLVDLEPAVLEVVGNGGGMSASSEGLARYAVETWATGFKFSLPAVDLLVDAAGGHQSPLGAEGLCPCNGEDRTVVARTGHAAAWSAVVAYDFAGSRAVGIVLDRDVDDAVLHELLQRLIDAARA